MPDVLDAPKLPPPLPDYPNLRPFTSQTASLAARRKHELAREREAAENQKPTQITETPTDARLSLLEEQIALTRATLNDGVLLPHHRASLLRALCELLDQQRIAKGEPLPGSRRPVADRVDRRAPAGSLAPLSVASPVAVPVPSPPEQVAPGPARALGWEYDEPSAPDTPTGSVPTV